MWGDGDVEIREESKIPPKPIVKSAKDLAVFKRAYVFSLELHKVSLTFPKIEQFSLANQLRRASKSVGANLVEGFSRQSESKLEFKRYITIAIGSANETDLWINYAFDLGYINQDMFRNWVKENDVVIGMLVNLRKRL